MSIAPNDLFNQPPPSFGKETRKHFPLDPDFACLNNGSYGTIPTPVAEAAAEWTKIIERNPDRFHKITFMPKLVESRKQVAEFINADLDEVVLVNNTTTGINTVLRNFEWDKEDVLIGFSTTYAAMNATINYISDVKPNPKKAIMPLNFPTTNDAILTQFRAFLQAPETQSGGPNAKRVCIIDSLISNPGILLPWQEMVKICKEEGVWSVVDGAHSIGQEPGIDMKAADPDFWVSNLHKWLMCHRSIAVLYIPSRNQHIIKTSVPTGNFYIPLADRNGDPNIQIQFEWHGTINWTPYMTVPDALAFRKWLGGEDKINEYCHDLAMKGGKLLSEKWGTQLMDPEGVQTCNMVNVELPIPADTKVPHDGGAIVNKLMLEKYNAYSAIYFHNGKWWTRCSAQVFNDISDFEKLADTWSGVADFIKKEWV
ncbi:pyridoxal phosphate-dependent transferase [Coprinopsis sp. MPI-PUGE-AT-0042]|nr:pyridoxal phosphate-dependent transferase [Coprinopsis sp. MPI-PUGE-AT-0042]